MKRAGSDIILLISSLIMIDYHQHLVSAQDVRNRSRNTADPSERTIYNSTLTPPILSLTKTLSPITYTVTASKSPDNSNETFPPEFTGYVPTSTRDIENESSQSPSTSTLNSEIGAMSETPKPTISPSQSNDYSGRMLSPAATLATLFITMINIMYQVH